MKTYGISEMVSLNSKRDILLEEVKLRGYSIIDDYLSEEFCADLVKRVTEIYNKQVNDIGLDILKSLNEENIVRNLVAYDDKFINLVLENGINEVIADILGPNYQLSLMNAVINTPDKVNHQSSWHRDLPYQEWTISSPLALNAFYCLTDFKVKNGATRFIPFSHKMESCPSTNFIDNNQITIEAKQGAIIVFDSMLYHSAGINYSNENRVGMNALFTKPLIKQQINYSRVFANHQDPRVRRIMGVRFDTPDNELEFREKRIARR